MTKRKRDEDHRNSASSSRLTRSQSKNEALSTNGNQDGKNEDADEIVTVHRTPSKVRSTMNLANADKSARKKSNRYLLKTLIGGAEDDEDRGDELARKIVSDSNSDDSQDETEDPDSDESLKGYENYFQLRKAKVKTSTNTTASMPTLELDEYQSVLRNLPDPSHAARKRLFDKYKLCYAEWRFLLENKHNLLFYGFGSKRSILHDFTETQLSKHPLFIVNGFFPSLSIKTVLQSLLYELDKTTRLSNNLFGTVAHICAKCKELDERLIILIHNIDGYGLRNDTAQSILAMLGECDYINMIASVDHVNAPLLWNSAKLSQFGFIWYELTTFDPYEVETSYESILDVVAGKRQTGARGAQYVLASLTGNARGIYRVLLTYQLELMGDVDDAVKGAEKYGLEYRTLYSKCSEEFLASNDIMFRTLLKEFYDHQMIMSKKEHTGNEIIWAPFEKAVLERLLEDLVLQET